jgi:hypothetical protein
VQDCAVAGDRRALRAALPGLAHFDYDSCGCGRRSSLAPVFVGVPRCTMKRVPVYTTSMHLVEQIRAL